MKIAFFVHGVTPGDLARAEFYAVDLAILRALGHEVYWVADPSKVQPRTDLIYCWWWTYAWLVLPVALARRIPLIVTGVFDLPTYAARPPHQRFLMRLGARLASANVFVSRFELDGARQRFRLRRADYVPLAVDTSIYHPPLERGRYEAALIANVTWKRRTNVVRKMLPELVEAMRDVSRRVDGVKLVLAGPPEDGERVLRELVRRLDLGRVVDFAAELTRDEKIALFQRSDLYVQCSRYEGFGLAIAEAMACGSTVLVSPSGPVLEVVGDCGRYVEGPTPRRMADAIVETLVDRSAASLGLRAAERISQLFSVPVRRAGLERVIGGVIRAE